MPRKPMNRSRLSGRLLLQVAASMAATLIGSALFTAMPNFAGWSSGPWVELTSGGKYAARVPGAGSPSVDPAAEAVARTRAPLPILKLPADQGVVKSDAAEVGAAKPSAIVDVFSDNGLAAGSLDKPVRVKPHMIRSASLHRADLMVVPRHAVEPVLVSSLTQSAPAATAEDGVVSKVVASARSLWSLTASTGGMIIDHLAP